MAAPTPATRRRTTLLVAAALALCWAMAVSVSPRMGVTADEVVHLTGGYSYWKFNDYRLHPENGTLPMRVAALPLLAMDLKFPPLDDPEWVKARVHVVGEKFFFQLGNPVDRMLLASRAMVALFGVFTAWLTWRWARHLFGATAGWIALGLAVFCPALLAHSGLATSDIAMTACLLAALSAVWQLLHRATWLRLALAALACGATFLAKMSGVILVPLLGAMLAVRLWRGTPLVLAFGPVRWVRHRGRAALAALALLVAVGAGSLGVLWAGYEFRFDGINHARSASAGYYFTWDIILDRAEIPRGEPTALTPLLRAERPTQPTTMTALIDWIRQHRLLPEAYLFGFAHTYKFARYRPAFFLGDYRTTGWPAFFPIAFLFKTTLPALLLGLAGGAALLGLARRPPPGVRPWLYRLAPLLGFFAVYWIMAVRMNLNIGHRHILPTYPVFYVVASAAVLWLAASRHRRAVGLALALAVAAHAAASLAARPFYLSYFQPLAGGMQRGWRHFVDSSFDWGQGLPDLQAWLERRRAGRETAPVFLTYFGADSPRARGLAAIRFADELNDFGERSYPAPLRGGTYVISATCFQRVYLPLRGAWTELHESIYADLLRRRAEAATRPPQDEPGKARLLQDLMDLELMQFGRLCHFLGDREPVEIVGGSLLVFPLTDAEVGAALYGPLPRTVNRP